MSFTRLSIEHFGAFTEAKFDLAPGVNVLIGENGTGKTQVLKLLYVLYEVARKNASEANNAGHSTWELSQCLDAVFLPVASDFTRLIHRSGSDSGVARAAAIYNEVPLDFEVFAKGTVALSALLNPTLSALGSDIPAIYLPSREVLSIARVFISDLRGRRTGFDKTYFDLAEHLYRSPLAGPRDAQRKALLAPLEAALGGEVQERGGQFYVVGQDGEIEMPLLGEGLRKIAQLVHLVDNGSLRQGSLLLWDEPEANLGAGYAELLASTILGLARQDVQVVLATHDYVLASELSRQIERARDSTPPCAFFSLRREEGGLREVERSDSFALLQNNPILDAMAALHDRELSDGAE